MVRSRAHHRTILAVRLTQKNVGSISLEEVRLMCEFDVTWVEDLLSYFKGNLDLVERNHILWDLVGVKREVIQVCFYAESC